MLNIILRTCTATDSASVKRFGLSRPLASSKRELVLACMNSLLDSLGGQGVVHVLDDHSPSDDKKDMRALLRSYSSAHQFVPLNKGKGAGNSLQAAFLYAKENDFPFVYFCEDDYLHLPHAIVSMLDCYERYHSVIFPVDYYDRYVGRDEGDVYPSNIYLGAYNYWRTVHHTTATVMLESRILQEYWDVYCDAADREKKIPSVGWEDETTNKIYQLERCLSPLPSLAAHVSPFPPLPPFVDWEGVFQSNCKQVLKRLR